MVNCWKSCYNLRRYYNPEKSNNLNIYALHLLDTHQYIYIWIFKISNCVKLTIT
jgi:hypothetical protein